MIRSGKKLLYSKVNSPNMFPLMNWGWFCPFFLGGGGGEEEGEEEEEEYLR